MLAIAAVQFINVLDFVIVMPLGPDFARALGVSEARLGHVNGAYTAAACVAGLLGAVFLDRFDRRAALGVTLAGLVLGTAGGGFATDFATLLASRVVAGAFGGPATSLCFSILADVVPQSRRGRAMGTVMAAFSLASVAGVPSGLLLAEHLGWRAPFFALAALGALVSAVALAALPPLKGHLASVSDAPSGGLAGLARLLRDPLVLLACLMTATVMAAGFSVIPNIAAYLQLNLGLPRPSLKWAYLMAGAVTFFTTQLGGRLVDRFGPFAVSVAGASGFITVAFTVFYLPHEAMAPALVYLAVTVFMAFNGLRNVAYNTLATEVPEPAVRASYQSLQSAVKNGASAGGAMVAAQLLSTGARPDGAGPWLVGMPKVAALSMVLTLAIPVVVRAVQQGVRARARASGPSGGAGVSERQPASVPAELD